jgi:hypothetical protein
MNNRSFTSTLRVGRGSVNLDTIELSPFENVRVNLEVAKTLQGTELVAAIERSRELEAEAFLRLIDICLTDPAHVGYGANVGDKPPYVAEPWQIGDDVIFGSREWFENIDPESY